jgi:hypothetical protein
MAIKADDANRGFTLERLSDHPEPMLPKPPHNSTLQFLRGKRWQTFTASA